MTVEEIKERILEVTSPDISPEKAIALIMGDPKQVDAQILGVFFIRLALARMKRDLEESFITDSGDLRDWNLTKAIENLELSLMEFVYALAFGISTVIKDKGEE